MVEEIKKLIASYEEFLKGADKVLEALQKGELRGQQRSAAEEIERVQKQIRDVENILPKLRVFVGYP